MGPMSPLNPTGPLKPGPPTGHLASALRSEAVRPALLGGAVFLAYALGACWTIYVGDSGELATAVRVLGIPHPSGYPLYVLLGKVFTLLVPAGSFAWRLSLFSAAASAAACAILYRLARAMGLGSTAAVAGALTLAFSPSFWAEATVQRVYGLDALFVVLAALAAWRWTASRRPGFLVLAFFLCGLGASNHTFMAVEAAALGIFVVIVEPVMLLRLRVIALTAAAFAAGLLPYLYLPVRSRQNPLLDWGNPETPRALLSVVLRRDFWERRWIETPSDLAVIAWDWARSFGPELAYAGAALALLGMSPGRRAGRARRRRGVREVRRRRGARRWRGIHGARGSSSCSRSSSWRGTSRRSQRTDRARTSSSGIATTFRPTSWRPSSRRSVHRSSSRGFRGG